jgi:hypothetical protein
MAWFLEKTTPLKQLSKTVERKRRREKRNGLLKQTWRTDRDIRPLHRICQHPQMII